MPPHGDDNLLEQLRDAVNGRRVLPWPSLARTAEAVCRRVASRDLRALPVYVGLASKMRSRSRTATAWTAADLSWQMRPMLGARWRGPGIGICVNDLLLLEDGDLSPVAVVGPVLHEAAHTLADLSRLEKIRISKSPSPEALEFATMIGELCLASSAPVSPAEQLVYNREHDPRTFLRVALHLVHRVHALAGIRVPPQRVQPQLKHWCRADMYQPLLGDEPARMVELTFAEILAQPLPRAYEKQWREDVLDIAIHESQGETPCPLR